MKTHASKRWMLLLRDALIIGLVVGAVLLACIYGTAFADIGANATTREFANHIAHNHTHRW